MRMSEKVQTGSIVEGKVIRIKPFGAIVSLGEGLHGLVHISQIADSFVKDVNDHLAVGDVVKVKLLSHDESTGKISLSIREANQPKESAPPVNPEKASIDFEDRIKNWLKQANDHQAGINKRNNRKL